MSSLKLPSKIQVWWGNVLTKEKHTDTLLQSNVTDPDVYYMINLGWPTTWGSKDYYCWRKKDE